MREMIDQVQNNNFVFVLFFGIYKPESWTMFLEISPSNSIYIFLHGNCLPLLAISHTWSGIPMDTASSYKARADPCGLGNEYYAQ